MADANTTKYGFILPEVGASADSWGGKLSQNHTDTDALLGAYALAGGTTAYTLTTGLSLAAYVNGQSFLARVNATCTGASTLSVDSIGAKNLRKIVAGTLTAIASGDLVAGEYYRFTYNSSSDVIVIHGVLYSMIQPLDATLTAFAAQTTGADLIWYWTGTDAGATTAFGASARSLLAGTTLVSYTMLWTDAGSTPGPSWILDRNSASPAANDNLGDYTFRGRDSGGNATDYAIIRGGIVDATDGSEDGVLKFYTINAGLVLNTLLLGGGLYTPTVTGGDKGYATINFDAFYEAGERVGLKRTPTSSETSGALTAASANSVVNATAGVSIASGVFTAGDRIWIYNNTASAITITETSGTLRLHGTTTAGNRTLAARGFCEIYCLSTTQYIATGPDIT